MKIAIGSDHAGFELKSFLIDKLEAAGYDVKDYGTDSSDSVDYPDFAHPVSNAVEAAGDTLGILICGSANGVCMTANKHTGIRCALSWNEEIAKLAREHNNANIVALPARFLSMEESWRITQAFLKTDFAGGRHQRRVEKIPA
jgi:ribose 5-phosphate isomerase B